MSHRSSFLLLNHSGHIMCAVELLTSIRLDLIPALYHKRTLMKAKILLIYFSSFSNRWPAAKLKSDIVHTFSYMRLPIESLYNVSFNKKPCWASFLICLRSVVQTSLQSLVQKSGSTLPSYSLWLSLFICLLKALLSDK